MVDAGIAWKKVQTLYKPEFKLDALLITHGHGDHIGSAHVIGNKTGTTLYMPEPTYREFQARFAAHNVEFIKGGDILDFPGFSVAVFSTKHDSPGSVGFVITDKESGKKYGHITDTGMVTPTIREAVMGCEGLFVEADYDEEMLEKNADYHIMLKERITSPLGHLSNQQTLDFINNFVDINVTEFIIIGHLSRKNNSPVVLRQQIENILNPEWFDKIHISFDKITLELI